MDDPGPPLTEALRDAFRQVPAEEARRLWTCDDAVFLGAVRPAPGWWGRGEGGWFASAYAAIAARFPPPDGGTAAERTRREVESLLAAAAAHLGPGALRILDIPCGAGRHARALAARGHDVLAIDLQDAPLRRLAPVPAAAADMRRLPLAAGGFDLVLNLWNSLGYFAEEAEDVAALAEFRRVLRPGGLAMLQFDLDARAILEGRWVQHMKLPLGEGALFLLRQVPLPARDGLACLAWVVLPDQAPWQGPAFFLRVRDDAAWGRAARAAGFTGLAIDRTPHGVLPHETLIRLLA